MNQSISIISLNPHSQEKKIEISILIHCIYIYNCWHSILQLSFNLDNAWMISGLKLSSTLPKVANKSWKQRQIKGDRWRPAKNPPMTKLVSLWFWFEGKVYRSLKQLRTATGGPRVHEWPGRLTAAATSTRRLCSCWPG